MRSSHFIHTREKEILNFLKNKTGSINDLLVFVNDKISEIDSSKSISLRSVEKDIKRLIEIGHQIKSYKPSDEELRLKYSGLRYKDYPHKENVDLNKVKFLSYDGNESTNKKLRNDEFKTISEALVILEKYEGHPDWNWAGEFIEMCHNSLGNPLELTDKIDYNSEAKTRSSIIYNEFKQALFNQNTVKIKRSINENILEFEYHVHFLKFWNYKWYAFGQKDNNKRPYVIPIDYNIKSIKFLNKKYCKTIINYSGEPIENWYFKDIIGVTNLNKKPTKIILKFNGREKFNIINSKPPHHSWTIKENQDGLFATMYLQHNNELENLILQLIPEVEVIHPKKLRKSIFEKLSISKNSHTN